MRGGPRAPVAVPALRGEVWEGSGLRRGLAFLRGLSLWFPHFRTWSVEAFFHEDGYMSEVAFAKEVNRLIQVGQGNQ